MNRPPDDNESPDVPGFRSWRGIYWFVLGAFVAVVVLLAIFTGAYSG